MQKKPSPIERKVKTSLKELGLRFSSQIVIGTYIVDFLSNEHKLIIECDGAAHHSSQAQRDKDKLRDLNLQKQGYQILRLMGWQCWNQSVCKGLIMDFMKQSGVLTPCANGPVLEETNNFDKTAKTETINLVQTH